MANENQDRWKEYQELERYIEELQGGGAAHPPADVTPEQRRIYRMAAVFRSAFTWRGIRGSIACAPAGNGERSEG